VTWAPAGGRVGRNVTSGRDGEYWRMLLPDRAGLNTFTVQVRLTMQWVECSIQAVFADCEPGGSGRVFASLRHRVIVSERNPLKEQHMYLKQVIDINTVIITSF
jgi:hypothetical protein